MVSEKLLSYWLTRNGRKSANATKPQKINSTQTMLKQSVRMETSSRAKTFMVFCNEKIEKENRARSNSKPPNKQPYIGAATKREEKKHSKKNNVSKSGEQASKRANDERAFLFTFQYSEQTAQNMKCTNLTNTHTHTSTSTHIICIHIG